MSSLPADQVFYTSLVVEHIVPYGKGFAFRRWYARLVHTARQQSGFVRADLCPPLRCADGIVKWYAVMHFDSPENLDRWLSSPERTRILKAGQEIFKTYRFKSFTTGLEGWFSNQSGEEQSGLGPPVWKQILAVVLGLYPIVMLQSIVFSRLGIMQSWPLANSMLVNNLLTSSILSLIVMPQITRILHFWLRPAYRLQSLKSDVLGTGLIVASFGMMVLMFRYLFPS